MWINKRKRSLTSRTPPPPSPQPVGAESEGLAAGVRSTAEIEAELKKIEEKQKGASSSLKRFPDDADYAALAEKLRVEHEAKKQELFGPKDPEERKKGN